MSISYVWTHPRTGGRLFVGGVAFDSFDSDALTAADIQSIVSLAPVDRVQAGEMRRNGRRQSSYLFADGPRLPDARIEWAAVRSVVQSLLEGEGVLVHCVGGVNRSPYVAARVLIELGLSPLEAVGTIDRQRRVNVLSNHTFLVALLGEETANDFRAKRRRG